jgi:hypothetical protein
VSKGKISASTMVNRINKQMLRMKSGKQFKFAGPGKYGLWALKECD